MATKTIQMYRTNLDGSETTLYPLTEAKYVTMDDGTTIEEALTNSDSSKYSPVIESSKAMFKVGEGDSVDLSESAIDGAYNSCVLKGKTMVNCIQEPSSQDVVLPYEFEDGQYVTINDTKESGALGVELKGQTLVNSVLFIDKTLPYTWVSNNISSRTCSLRGNFKTGTYALIVDFGEVLLGGVQSSQGVSCSIQVNYTNGTLDAYMRNGLENYSNKRLFTPFNINNEVSTIEFKGVSEQYENATTEGYIPPTVTVNKIMIIEYQEGMENWDIPYFTGMTSCKMPILTTTGKNLFEGEFVLGEWNGIRIIESLNRLASSKLIEVRGGSTLTLSSQVYQIRMLTFLDENKKWIGHSVLNDSNTLTVKTPNNCKYIGFNLRKSDNTNFTEDEIKINSNVMVEYGTQATPFEPYKTSILSLPEEVVLRSLPNGVCDTFNTRTSEYVQRIGEVVLDGSEDEGWIEHSTSYFDNLLRWQINLTKLAVQTSNREKTVMCDKVRVVDYRNFSMKNYEFVCIHEDGSNLQLMLEKTKATTITQLKQYLQQNPLTVQYELKTPVTIKINLSSTLKSWNTITHVYSEIPENTLYPTLSHSNPTYPVILKPSTKYSIVANSYSNNHTNSAINFNLGGATASTVVGNRVTTITTPSTLTSEELVMSGRGNKLNNVMVIEGDVVGDEPYFEGICDCKTPILSNVGKNLFTIKNGNRPVHPNHSIVAMGDNHINITSITDEVGWIYTTYEIKGLKPNTTYILSAEISEGVNNSSGSRGTMLIHDFKMNVSSPVVTSSNKVIRYTTPTDISDIGLLFYSSRINTPNKVGDTYDFKNIHLQIEQANTDYEPYKSNTTTFNQKDDKTIVLRSLPNGVCDTLNIETGEYVQRIGEVVLDGSTDEEWIRRSALNEEINTYCFNSTLPERGREQYGTKGICDKSYFGKTWVDEEHVWINEFSRLTLHVKQEKLGSDEISNLQTWLSQNPLTVQYELETPIVSTIDVQGFPYAYKDGHVQLSSGHSGQSLTPKVEYSLVANRNGQIETNTKQIRRHQDKLDDFEALMLTQMVQSHYEKTLLQFNYEMQMMALGGE